MTSFTLPLPITTSAGVRDLEQASSTADADAATREECEACPHPFAAHDSIALRFCSATGDGAIARGCVCQS